MVAAVLAARSGASSSAFLASFRSLSLAVLPPSRTIMARSGLLMQQASHRCTNKVSHAPFTARQFSSVSSKKAVQSLQSRSIRRPTLSAALPKQQTRGMKVHSSVKKRCEHCKVRRLPLWNLSGWTEADLPLAHISLAAHCLSTGEANSCFMDRSFGVNEVSVIKATSTLFAPQIPGISNGKDRRRPRRLV